MVIAMCWTCGEGNELRNECRIKKKMFENVYLINRDIDFEQRTSLKGSRGSSDIVHFAVNGFDSSITRAGLLTLSQEYVPSR